MGREINLEGNLYWTDGDREKIWYNNVWYWKPEFTLRDYTWINMDNYHTHEHADEYVLLPDNKLAEFVKARLTGMIVD